MSKPPLPLAIEHALLGFLQAGPLHGYEIDARLRLPDGLGQVWRLKQPHLYALLTKLEAAALIQAEIIAQDARPTKRLLQLTPQGKQTFADWLVAPVKHGRDFRIEFLAKLFWAHHQSHRVTALVAAQTAVTSTWLARLEQTAAVHPPHSYNWRVAHFRIGQVQATLAWLPLCLPSGSTS